MKRILFGLILLTIAGLARAQNNPIFYGGLADGFATKNLKQSMTNSKAGGIADGWGTNRYLQSIVHGNAGGMADGWATSNYLPNMTNAFAGGFSDGWTSSNYLQPITNNNAGGMADGWAAQRTIPYKSPTNKGGMGDGWASNYHALSPLPINFLRFEATKDKQRVRINWEMGDEDDVMQYEVQRSDKAVVFDPIGTVDRNDVLNKHYVFYDEKPISGHNYYRLRVWKKDGTSEFTPTRLVIFDKVIVTTMNLYPNPANDKLFVELPQDFSGTHVVFNIYDAAGKMVYQQKNVLQITPVELNVATLAAGNYFVHIGTENNSAVAKFVIVR
ncbi:MAG: T9SS type A sorting domain-containing protein [Bacteroidetes bacterium]|nr:T9SS type A sorting domain-containing protein [Bacteroidota bacterium]